MPKPNIRKLEPWVPLTKDAYRTRFMGRFYDPAFDEVKEELERVFEKAWEGYENSRKSPRTRPAGPEFAEPEYELSLQWLDARAKIKGAEKAFADPNARPRILLVNGSTRSENTCPGETSKTRRLLYAAREEVAAAGFEIDVLDLSDLADEPLLTIHPCKACVSTAMPLCHWPCSCYPNNALGQTNDWMFDIYPAWVRAHGVMIVAPVHWYQAPASLKLMMDRLVCADGGNPDPTTTGGKDVAKAKDLELAGWSYPKHLAGRAFSVVAHGDAVGPREVRTALCDWLEDMGLVRASHLDRYIGYFQPYATSHDDLDGDEDVFAEVKIAARALVTQVNLIRSGRYQAPDEGLTAPRQK